jgi:hypothetical protein
MTANLALLPVAGAAARQIFDSVAGAVSNGLSFAASLGSPDKAADAADVHSTATAADGAPVTTNDGKLLQWRAAWQQLKRDAEELGQVVRERLAAADIDASDPIALSVDGGGRVLVARGHWERSSIEKVFEDDPQLRAQVQDLLQRVAAHQDATGTNGNDMQLVIDADSVTFARPS